MNAEQAKKIPLKVFLDRLGHKPVREHGEEFWYRSPLREEQSASFRVSQKFNNWVDWGTGERGDIITFAQKHFNVDTSGALREIERVMGPRPVADLVAFRATREQPIETSIAAERIELGPIKSFALRQYLEKRGINRAIADEHLQEARYTVGGRPYFALAFPNDSGGHETRNLLFKGTLGHKAISTLRIGERKGVAVFEGFMDFLSALQLNALPDEVGQVVVLNSVALAEQGLAKIKDLKPDAVYLFLDNDDAGDRLVGLMTTRLTCPLVDASLLYESYKDFNEMLVARQRSR